jgi:hypothetical protein
MVCTLCTVLATPPNECQRIEDELSGIASWDENGGEHDSEPEPVARLELTEADGPGC